MANVNKVMLMGNLTHDPEVRYTPKGTAVGDLRMAVNRRVPDGNGNWSEEATYLDVTVWGNTAENAQKYLSKGRAIFVEGRLQLDTWEDKQSGQKRSKLKVVGEVVQFLPDGKGGKGGGSNRNDNDSGSSGYSNEEASSSQSKGGSAASNDDFDEEEDQIPF